MGAAAPIIGGVGTVFSLAGQQSSQRAQAQAAADQQAMLAKQNYYNALALNSAQTNLAYDYDTSDLQQRQADLQATQANFQQLTQAREQHLANSGQVDYGRFQAQQQYFGSLFGQAQQSTNTAYQSANQANSRIFGVGVQGLQEAGTLTRQGMDSMFGAATNAMNREQQVSSQGLGNMLQTGVQGITNTTNTFLEGSQNVFNTTNQASDAYTSADVGFSDAQSQGFNETRDLSNQLNVQAQELQKEQYQQQQQQSVMDTMYSAMLGGANAQGTLSGQNRRDQAANQSVSGQQQYEQGANNAIGQTMRNADYRNTMAGLNLDQIGALGSEQIGYAGETANLNNQNVSLLSLMNDLNAAGNYNRDTTFARDIGALDTSKAAQDFNTTYGNFAHQNQLNIDYANYQNQTQGNFMRDFLTQQDAYTQRNAAGTLQSTNANLNNFLSNSLRQKQLAEMGYQQGNYQIGTQSQDNSLANYIAMLTGQNNARLQSDANNTINQAQQASSRMQQASSRGPNLFDYANAGLGIYSGINSAFGGNQQNPYNSGFSFTPYQAQNYNYNPQSSGGFFSNSGLYGNPAATYGAAPPSLGLGTF